MKKILITGCSGFIGRHAVSHALERGYKVVGLDMKPFGKHDDRMVFIKGDINDKPAVERAAKGCDYIFHLAAATSIADFQYNLHRDYGTNVMGFLKVIEVAKKNKCKKLAYASSSAVYSSHKAKMYGEDAVIDIKTLRNHYGKSKFIDEAIADSYMDATGLKAVGVRYFNVYGPGEEVKLRSSPITQFILSMRKNSTITLFGDGTQKKDFVHIDDAIKITFMLMENPNATGVYNVGTGVATALISVAKFMAPKKILYIKNPYLSSYIFYLKADTRKLLKALKGYKFINVKDGISMLIGNEVKVWKKLKVKGYTT